MVFTVGVALNKPMSNKGFTLIELLSTTAIIAIITVIGIVTYQQVLKNGRDAKRQADLKSIQSVLEQYRVDQGFYPNNVVADPSFDAVLSTGDVFTNSTGNPNSVTIKTYLKSLPINFPGYPVYKYIEVPLGCNNTNNKCTDYCLYSNVENSANAKDVATCTNDVTRTLEMTKP